MRIVLFSGTTEGRELSRLLAERGGEIFVSVATDYGREVQGDVPGVTVLTGRRNREEMASLLEGAALCIDATHPYAVEATENIRGACALAGVPCRRLLREACAAYQEYTKCSPKASGEGRNPAVGTSEGTETVTVPDAAAAAAFLENTTGNILLTTGAKELGRYAGLDPARLFPRILPTHEGLSACEALAIPHRNILAMQGPFSRELNEAVIRQYRIAYLVTKDGGRAGGFPEKVQAARNTGAVVILLRRPAEAEAGAGFAAVAAECLALLKGERIPEPDSGRVTELDGGRAPETDSGRAPETDSGRVPETVR